MTTEPFELRPASLDDVVVVASWLRSWADCELWAGYRVAYPVDLEKLPGAIEWPVAHSLSATRSGALSAFGQLVPKPAGRLHLARIIVQPEARGRGLGGAFVRLLLDAARELEPARLSLNVARDNAPALRLYASLGFAEAPRPSEEPPSSASYQEYHAP